MLQARGSRPKRFRVVNRILIVVAGLVVVAVLASVGFAAFLGTTFDRTRHTIADPFPSVRAPAPTGPAAHSLNILLLGHDADAADAETPQFVGKQEADTVMLIHVPADRSRIYMISILRNSLVAIPGHGQQAVNAALAYGGMPLQVQTVEQLLGVRIDHVVSLSLVGLKGLTDALGGVTVQNTLSFQNQGFTFRPGSERLDGTKALAYVRGAHRSAKGDAGRARAQAAYLKGVLEDAFRAKTLLNPGALATAVSVLAPYMTVDKGFDSAFVGALGVSLRDVRAADVKTYSLPAPTVRKLGTAHVLALDRTALARVKQHLADESLGQLFP